MSAMHETWVQSLVWEDTLEKEMATHSSILAWKIPWTEEPDGLQFMCHKELDTTGMTNTFTAFFAASRVASSHLSLTLLLSLLDIYLKDS